MLEDAYRFERFHPRHAEKVAHLQRGLWSPDPQLNRDYLRWKYFENPCDAPPLIRLAFHGDELVAMRGMYASQWEWDSSERALTLPVAGDTVIREDHWSRGLFRALTAHLLEDAAEAGHPAALSLSASPATALRSLRMGWKKVGPLPMLRRGGWRRAQSLFGALLPAPGVRIRDAVDVDTLAEALTALPARGLRHRRDPDFLSWRFRNPLFRYRFCQLREAPRAGALVVQRARAGGRQTIVAWQARDEAGERILLEGMLRRCGADSLGVLVGPLTRDRSSLLGRRGFTLEDRSGGSRRFEPALLVVGTGRPSAPGSPDLFDPACWDLQLLGSDGV
ncbi:MAG: GNAT family N-acetyltransferase [Gemmatimonadetes bacterium]|nr:GNAT family N-acetyltransferase [Gemmatimonadota bacterium]NNK64705.1 GNAT family N-acetyltransferase [Gemmatimonadota bacterium]